MTEQCNRCRFWQVDKATLAAGDPCGEDIAFGRCRRNAPVVIGALAALGVPRTPWGRDTDMESESLSSMQVHLATRQPVTENVDWCGEFREACRENV
ncbi:hypothetical protein EWE75_13570 [Sphingomonas populi]|uniref:Uncharacterized protein n=1 Tax=Sphingomonas populi TaxID=2484750 RepID=A0A4Q6XUM2_9SPHN|nr:hypothetical protein [Sphingomonas populi]RZF64000.1 hypothetical protein EWE75_13570 [Sphingomonas populi]